MEKERCLILPAGDVARVPTILDPAKGSRDFSLRELFGENLAEVVASLEVILRIKQL